MLMVRAVLPEFGIVALRGLVVEDDEVADVLEQSLHPPVVLVALDRVEALVGEQASGSADAALDEVDAGRFQRLDEAARKAERDDVAVPGELAPAGA